MREEQNLGPLCRLESKESACGVSQFEGARWWKGEARVGRTWKKERKLGRKSRNFITGALDGRRKDKEMRRDRISQLKK